MVIWALVSMIAKKYCDPHTASSVFLILISHLDLGKLAGDLLGLDEARPVDGDSVTGRGRTQLYTVRHGGYGRIQGAVGTKETRVTFTHS